MSLDPSRPVAQRPVAFYVHHHGSGHATRCKQIARAWPDESPLHVFTSAPHCFEGWAGGTLHILPPDTEEGRDPSHDMLENEVFHYAPTNLRPHSRRMAIIANWIADADPKLFIVDLSCEIALFARLCGAKVALMRLHGYRCDTAHTAAYRMADSTLAPYPPCLEDEHTEDWIRRKTIYLGLFSRYDHRKENRAESILTILNKHSELGDGATWPGSSSLVTVVNGSGGKSRSVRYWERVARHNPDHHFALLGKLDRNTSKLKNLTVVGYVVDTYPYLRAADIVVGSGGTNTMCEVSAVRGRYLSLPEPRPFSEQFYKMKALERLGLTRAIPEDISPNQWKKWLRRARDLQPDRWRRVRRQVNFQKAILNLSRRYSGERIGAAASDDLSLVR